MQITIVGPGVMGRALAMGLQKAEQHVALRFLTRTEESAAEASASTSIPANHQVEASIAGAEVVVLCLKPHKTMAALESIAPHLAPNTVVISIAAGLRLAQLSKATQADQPLIRAMPNTPCRVGSGMTVLCGSEATDSNLVAKVKTIFEVFGEVMELEEEHFDAVTGLSASGPAFIFLVIEALSDGGVMAGLPRDVAVKLATQATLGAAAMVQQTGEHPASLRDAVTTPAGCTISALLRMEDGKLRSVLARGVQEAAESAARLGG
ncbi:MAG: pyrroline-5-carboxylate reductase [Planctomycetota bacterium]|jgi:pyrroline-5-carboxylate reductase